MRSIRLLVLVGAALAWSTLAWPAAATAQSGATNPLLPGFPQQTVSTPTTTTAAPTVNTTTTAGSGSAFSGNSAIIIAIGAIVVLGGISFFIWRDARKRAPVRHRAAGAGADAGGRQGSRQRAKPRKLSPAERRRRKRGRAR
ncbi:MAG TPA: hypothetical protein VEF89_09695 [Solirubrobacteraceae bacterium]|nr:hypothetical protein [Solirubrobacteraceae bacterium]